MTLLLFFLVGALACTDPKLDSCNSDVDCRSLSSCRKSCCVHKDLMPLAASETGGTILVFVLAGITNAGGIGGGPIMTAFELLLFHFEAKWAIPLSQCIIVAGCLINVAIQVLSRHPNKNRPIIDYHISMIILPPILLGSTYGVMANKVLPNWLILTLLTIVLVFLTFMTMRNGVKMFKFETQQKSEELKKMREMCKSGSRFTYNILEIVEGEMFELGDEIKVPLKIKEPLSPIPFPGQLGSDQERGIPPASVSQIATDEERGETSPSSEKLIPEELQRIYDREARQFPLLPIVWISFVVFYAALGLSVIGGADTSFAGVSFCGGAYKLLFSLWSVGMLLICFPAITYLLNLKKTYDRLGYDYDSFDIKWTKKKCIKIWAAGLVAGFGGSLLGFGASLILAPILVEWKMRHPCIRPTTALMTVIGSAIAAMLYAEQKMLDSEYAAWLAGVGLLGALVGVISLSKLMKMLGRPSLLVLTLAGVLGIAMILVPVYTIFNAIDHEFQKEGQYGLTPYC